MNFEMSTTSITCEEEPRALVTQSVILLTTKKAVELSSWKPLWEGRAFALCTAICQQPLGEGGALIYI